MSEIDHERAFLRPIIEAARDANPHQRMSVRACFHTMHRPALEAVNGNQAVRDSMILNRCRWHLVEEIKKARDRNEGNVPERFPDVLWPLVKGIGPRFFRDPDNPEDHLALEQMTVEQLRRVAEDIRARSTAGLQLSDALDELASAKASYEQGIFDFGDEARGNKDAAE
jgi:hypothetical protein